MSKNIIIKEGNTPQPFNGVKKIRINNIGSGYSYWVPEDETRLGTKSINKNGTYKASKDDLYGYSQVTVSGIGSTDFTAQEGDQIGGMALDPNEDYTHEEDGEGGSTVKLTPKSIRFDRQPYRTIYADGDDIDLAGAIVRAYSKKGKIIEDSAHPDGVIPYAELELVPDKADISKVSKETYTDGEVVAAKFEFNIVGESNWLFAEVNSSWGICNELAHAGTPVYLTVYDGKIYAAGESSATRCTGSQLGQDGKYHRAYATSEMAGNRVFNHMNFLTMFANNNLTGIPVSTADPAGKSIDGFHIEGGVQNITVKWKLKEELTTILPIEVIAEGEDDEDENETGGGGGEF